MGGAITRFTHKTSVTLNTAESTTPVIPFGGYAGGRVYIPSGSSITSLTFYDSSSQDGTFLPSYDDAGTPAAITLTVAAGRSYPIPAKMFGACAIKIVVNAAGAVLLSLKG